MKMSRAIVCGLALSIACSYLVAAEIEVPVGPDKDAKNAAGLGFGLLPEGPNDLRVVFRYVPQSVAGQGITYSERIDMVGKAIWTPEKQGDKKTPSESHVYQAAGVKPNDGHAVIFQGCFTRSGTAPTSGSTTPPEGMDFHAYLSDIDLDVDSDNDGIKIINRPPSETDSEDRIEYVTGNASPTSPLGVRAKVGEVIAIKLKVRKKTAGEISVRKVTSDPGEISNPTVKFYKTADGAKNENGELVDWSKADASGVVAYMKVKEDVVLESSFVPSISGCGSGDNQFGAAYDTVRIIADGSKVSFDPNPIITGYTKPLAQSTLHKKVVATFSADVDVTKVTFRFKSGTNADRAELKDIAVVQPIKQGEENQIEFRVYGKIKTPKSTPYGDTTIEAVDGNGVVLGEAQAIVVVPDEIAKPYPEASGKPIAENLCLNQATSPFMPGIPSGSYIRATCFYHWLTISVNDQFGSTLDRAYEGVAVAESFDGTPLPMNQKITALGTYRDPVGVMKTESNVPLSDNNPQEALLIAQWPKEQPLPIPALRINQNIGVIIGGHSLLTGIIDRSVTSEASGNVTIVWK